MRTERIGHLKIKDDPTGSRTRNLPSCGAVSQPIALLAPATAAAAAAVALVVVVVSGALVVVSAAVLVIVVVDQQQ